MQDAPCIRHLLYLLGFDCQVHQRKVTSLGPRWDVPRALLVG